MGDIPPVTLPDQHGVQHEIPHYIPAHWHRRLTVETDDKGTHFLMGGWNNGEGHAKCRMDGKATYAYRWVVERVEGRTLRRFDYVDHRCERKPCVVYEHLEPTTPGTNIWRGPGRQHQFRKAEDYAPPDLSRGDPLDDL